MPAHPSMGNDEEDPSEGPELPEGVTEEAIEELIGKLAEVSERIGLHSTGMVHMEQHGDHLIVGMHFAVGELAFKKEVQDPQQAKFDDEFRKFSAGATEEQMNDIRNRYMKRPDPNE